MGVNPYEADPKRVSKKDPYLSRSPHYGRYAPQTDDFEPKFSDWHSTESETRREYWTEIVRKYCMPENSLNVVGSRAAFAIGKVLIHVDSDRAEGAAAERYSRLNENELIASRKAEEHLKDLDVAVPVIVFCGTIDGKNVVIETRIPGVSLEVAWNYLSTSEKESFKAQCQRILRRLTAIDDYPAAPSYVCDDLNSIPQPDIADVEHDILFAQAEDDEVLCLTHNNMVRSNIIVDNGRVVAITGWRQSGYFGHERAKKIHRLLRIPERSHIFGSGERSTQDGAWADLYDFLDHSRDSVQGYVAKDSEPKVKTEIPAASIEKVPAAQSVAHTPQYDGADEHPTPKKIHDLKRGSTSRASSIDRSSPSAPLIPSKLGPNARKTSSVSTKKASIATKIPSSKKRKIDAIETDSVDERRSNSPASSAKGPSVKKRASASVNGSPAPEIKKRSKPTKKKPTGKQSTTAATSTNGQQQEEEEDEGGSEAENPDEVFCICRRPDNHTWMIGCDGGCDDWFHGKCVNIKQEDEELIDHYICPNCHEAGRGQTTWKPMCRLKGCRKPARVSKTKVSKYCSDEHGREFMRQMTGQLKMAHAGSSTLTPPALDRVRDMSRTRDSRSVDIDGDSVMDTNDEDDEHDHGGRMMSEELGSRGGILTVSDLKAVIMGVSSSAEFRRLGDALITPPPSTSPPARRIESKPNKEEGEDEIMGKRKLKREKDSGETTAVQDSEEFEEEELFKSNKMGLDINPPGVNYSAAEEAKLQELRTRREQYRRQRRMISRRNEFLGLVRARAKAILDRLKAKEPKGGWKDICGWDARMSWNEEELDDWCQNTETGRKAFEEGKLEAEPIGNLLRNGVATTDDEDEDDDDDDSNSKKKNKNNHNNNTADAEFAELSRGVCMKKRCDRHKQWVKIVQQDIQFEEAMLKDEFRACEKEANAIAEGAILRIHAG
ncbi:PHD transcription factor, putative [Talaromyces stipitatus ATCC 10500]|uniref:PHD transcription factor, putative n=1 Tax=Talaromyces stipitatus (strain ATCC 10500 / CBS 375.48 / QM 6759 / NRRL 1006) TaxID=441959 RepID=B8M821_TALSN|nr:PHD transcription factor, putative [Talaromyces stipitatus ATCC 10500]EED19983.1 PHD transcription factor, putative [Talaromyces stipitatus ATCC 10500]